jgi:glycosyltransferase involved in cell wall biosynthesis
MPRVSIIIPTYNRARLLAEAIQSVWEQTVADYEIIVADDGSTDETAECVQQWSAPVRYLRLPHSGLPGVARNAGIRVATGEYIAFLDSDDLWVPDALAKRLAMFHAQPEVHLVYADAIVFAHGTGIALHRRHAISQPAAGWIGPQLLLGDFMPTPSVIVRRVALDTVGLFCEEPSLRWGEDWDLWLRIVARYQATFVGEPLVRVRFHAGKITLEEEEITWYRRHLLLIERACAFAPEVYGPVYRDAVCRGLLHTLGQLVEHGREQDARALLAETARQDPLTVRKVLTILREKQGADRTLLA